MKNDLTCAVVQDLLPAYVEGLTSAETNRAVDAHLSACADCAARKRAMTAPETSPEQAETVKEVDYLKKVKRRRWKWAAGAVFCTLALVAAGFAAKLFIIGTPAQEQELAVVQWSEDGGVLSLAISTPYSGTAHRGWTVETSDGVADIHARSVLVSPLFQTGGGTVEIPLEGIREVRLCGRSVWQDGVIISQEAWDLYQVKTPYLGNAPALGRIAEALGIHLKLGSYTSSLQTSERPYGWTLEFSAPMTEAQASRMNLLLTPRAVIMLALVENLDQVTWTYTDTKGAFHSRTVTVEDAMDLLREQVSYYANAEEAASCGAVLPDSVKDCAETPADLQRLLTAICCDPISD